MTTEDQRDLRELLTRRAEVREDEVEALRAFVAELPARRRRRPGLGLLAAAAGVTVLLGAGIVLANFNVRTGSTGPVPPDPAVFANDPRLGVCNAKPEDALAIFELQHVSDYASALPHAYPLIGLQADPNAPALVIVFKGPGGDDRFGSPAPAGSHDLCMVVGTDPSHWNPTGIVGVDITGLAGLEGLPPEPAPSGTPIAAEDQPWVERCGGVAAGINRVLHFAHGTDALTLNSIAVPASAMSDQPVTIVEYTGAHPFPPQGTAPPSGTTFAPRAPLQPGERDLCILTGAEPATATRAIVEFGTPIEPGPPPSVSPATPAPTAVQSAEPAPSSPDASSSAIAGCAMPSLPYDINDIHDDGWTYSGRDAPIPVAATAPEAWPVDPIQAVGGVYGSVGESSGPMVGDASVSATGA